jgi:hypothetical protein
MRRSVGGERTDRRGPTGQENLVMALGKRKDALYFTPLVKFDARAGKLFRCDRVQGDTGDWETKQIDITDNFSATIDMENIEVGWIAFSSGGAPDFKMVPAGGDIGERPSDNHKEGFRIHMKLTNGAGDDDARTGLDRQGDLAIA